MSFRRITLPDATAPGETEPREINVTNIGVLADKPKLTATALKAAFDAAGADIKTFLIGLVNEINATLSAIEQYPTAENAVVPGALNIGAAQAFDGDISAPNVQAKLTALKEYMDGLVVATGEGDMVKSVYVDAGGTGKVLAAANSDKLGGTAASGYAKEVSGQTAKSALADADAFPIADSENGGTQKKALWSTIKSAIQTTFTGVFAGISHRHQFSDLQDVAAYAHTHSGVYAPSTHTHTYSQLTGVAASTHTHTVTSLLGVVKCGAADGSGIRIFLDGESQAGVANGDLWFNS